jgi:uncharacterized protein
MNHLWISLFSLFCEKSNPQPIFALISTVGFPSVGKSTLLTTLTGTRSEAAAYEFTTLTCIPGTMKYKGARIQVLDLPGIIEGAADGKGRGRQVISTARTCNMILIVLDAGKPLTHKKIIENELFSFGIRINQKPPNVKVVKKEAGGIGYQEMVPQTKGLNQDVVRLILKEYKVCSCMNYLITSNHTFFTQRFSILDFMCRNYS